RPASRRQCADDRARWYDGPGGAATPRTAGARVARLAMCATRSRAGPAGGLAAPAQMTRKVRRRSSSGTRTSASRPAARSSGMAGGDDDGEAVMADDPAAQPGRPPRSLDEAQIRGPLSDVADDRLGVDRGQHDIGGRAARVAGRGPACRPPPSFFSHEDYWLL